ncbi:MAG: ribonuclease III [Gammaproteobacteria bacterium]|nr:ribonuclease III [Gammaproteobacteria bacterium]
MLDKQAKLGRTIGYDFSDEALLDRALTHRSKGAKNYERLEFLGDSILGFVVAEWLYQSYPELSEGKLSRMRASLVRKETLALVARELDLSNHLRLGEGELKSGGFNRDSILSDVVESLIGAMYLDGGLSPTREFILHRWQPHFDAIEQTKSFKDPKSRLQETMQKQSLSLPEYEIVATSGEQHEQIFTVRCALADLGLQELATAGSRRAAEQAAAESLLSKLPDHYGKSGKSR